MTPVPLKRFLTARQAKDIDSNARKKLGIQTLVLMENAGRQVAQQAIKSYRVGERLAIFCGKGNNGGDGLVAARHLLTLGIRPDIFLAAKISQVENEARINLEILLKLRQKITEVSEINLSKIKISKYGLIIDALLGVGLSGKVRGIYFDLIRLINSSKAYILSVDIPSGLDATTGRILGSCIKADETVSFVKGKLGMVLASGPNYCGKITIVDLGVPI
jgi:NAD(P)H-hydrate epimerase